MKVCLKFLLLIIALVVTVVITSTVLYSHTFMEAIRGITVQGIVYLLISSLWMSLTVLYAVVKSRSSTKQTVLCLFISLFFIYTFMTQIEILFTDSFFIQADIPVLLPVVIGDTIMVIVAVFLGIKFFDNNFRPSKYSRKPKKITPLEVFIKWLITGLLYAVLASIVNYVFFRISCMHGSEQEECGFIAQIIKTWNSTPQVYLICFVKGLLYGILLLPLIILFRKRSFALLISLVLMVGTQVVNCLIPDFLFSGRIWTESDLHYGIFMFLFAVSVWLLFDKTGSKTSY